LGLQAFFAPEPRYLASRHGSEFKAFVKAFHAAGLEVILNVVWAGNLFGEMAAICNLPRTADVSARRPLKVLQIDGDVFLRLVTGNPEAALGVMRILSLSERLMRFTELYERMKRSLPEGACPKLRSENARGGMARHTPASYACVRRMGVPSRNQKQMTLVIDVTKKLIDGV
jgi:CRP-like cAMP-binding protein